MPSWRATSPRLPNWCAAMSRPPARPPSPSSDVHLAQDVLQESFLRAYNNLGKLADRSRFGPWILKIARRQALLALRKQRDTYVAIETEALPAVFDSNGRLDDASRT